MRISGLSEIAGRFDGMLIDQYGVIHDGERLYPGTLRAMQKLKAAGIPVAVMTNSGKRAAANIARLVRIGLPRELFVDAVSSGEVAYQALVREGPPRAYIIGRTGEDYGFDSLDLTADIHAAELLLILGSNAPATSLDDYRRLFEGLTAPAICCNPDKLMLTPAGLQPAPGAIAAVYEELGGKVTWIGKPYRSIYEHALRIIGSPRRVLCIGDSAEHDVAGGHGAGLEVLLVRTGVSAGLDRFDPAPDYLADSLTW
jgi:HAD superfamily hydrolase (TIGR01459 family)